MSHSSKRCIYLWPLSGIVGSKAQPVREQNQPSSDWQSLLCKFLETLVFPCSGKPAPLLGSEGAHSDVPTGIQLVLSKKLLLPSVTGAWWQLLPGSCAFLCSCSSHLSLC